MSTGAATIGLGFLVLLLAMPLVSLIPNAAEYLPFLYLCVLASCLRTLCTQFIRSRMPNRLVAIDGVLTTLSLLLYYLLFLSVLRMGATGFFAGQRAGGPDLDGVRLFLRAAVGGIASPSGLTAGFGGICCATACR